MKSLKSIIAVLSVTTVASCSWINGATNWANCNMPTMGGTRKGCEDSSSMANAPRNSPAYNAPAPNAPIQADPYAAPGMSNPMGTHPHSFGQPTNTPYGQSPRPNQQPADDFPQEYRNVPAARDYYDTMIPQPPI